MTLTQSTLLVIFGVIAYMIIVDENVAKFIDLWVKILRINVERFFWMVKYHPNNFVTTWLQNRKCEKISKELEKELMN